MKKFSNTYIFLYITVLVTVVAVVLSLLAMKLQPLQQRNRDVEKMQQILHAAGYPEIDKKQVIDLYKEVSQEWMVDNRGQIVARYAQGKFLQGSQRAFLIRNTTDTSAALPVFVIKQAQRKVFVVPVRGKGLWGPIWGYVAVADDGKTLVGTSFSHKSETPGLGGEITTDKFQSQFSHKTLFDGQGHFVSVQVVKGGVARAHADPQHAVDALSGATITSQGVDMMLRTCLVEYVPFFQKYIE